MTPHISEAEVECVFDRLYSRTCDLLDTYRPVLEFYAKVDYYFTWRDKINATAPHRFDREWELQAREFAGLFHGAMSREFFYGNKWNQTHTALAALAYHKRILERLGAPERLCLNTLRQLRMHIVSPEFLTGDVDLQQAFASLAQRLLWDVPIKNPLDRVQPRDRNYLEDFCGSFDRACERVGRHMHEVKRYVERFQELAKQFRRQRRAKKAAPESDARPGAFAHFPAGVERAPSMTPSPQESNSESESSGSEVDLAPLPSGVPPQNCRRAFMHLVSKMLEWLRGNPVVVAPGVDPADYVARFEFEANRPIPKYKERDDAELFRIHRVNFALNNVYPPLAASSRNRTAPTSRPELRTPPNSPPLLNPDEIFGHQRFALDPTVKDNRRDSSLPPGDVAMEDAEEGADADRGRPRGFKRLRYYPEGKTDSLIRRNKSYYF